MRIAGVVSTYPLPPPTICPSVCPRPRSLLSALPGPIRSPLLLILGLSSSRGPSVSTSALRPVWRFSSPPSRCRRRPLIRLSPRSSFAQKTTFVITQGWRLILSGGSEPTPLCVWDTGTTPRGALGPASVPSGLCGTPRAPDPCRLRTFSEVGATVTTPLSFRTPLPSHPTRGIKHIFEECL